MFESRQFCSFRLDGALFGVEVKDVQEVLRYQEMTPVPLAASVVEGLINLRGQIVTAIDMRRRMDLPERPPGTPPLNVVLRAGDGAVSLLVDEIGDVIDVSDDLFEPPPETLSGAAKTLITGAYKLDGELLLVLDIEKTLTLDHAGAASAGH